MTVLFAPRALKRRRPSRLRRLAVETLENRLLLTATPEGQHFAYLLNAARHDPLTFGQAAYDDLVATRDDTGQSAVVRERAEKTIDLLDTEGGRDFLAGVTPRGPVAVNENLFDSANVKTADKVTMPFYSGHFSPRISDPNLLLRENGYALPATLPVLDINGVPTGSSWLLPDSGNSVESLYSSTKFNSTGVFNQTPALEPLAGLIVDVNCSGSAGSVSCSFVPGLGHRTQLLSMDDASTSHLELHVSDREIGVSYDTVQFASVTFPGFQEFHEEWIIHQIHRDPSHTFLTGVVFDDLNGNNVYDEDEGKVGELVDAGGGLTATTNAQGGWSIQVAAGSYTVTHAGNSVPVTVAVGMNREIDYISGTKAFLDFEEVIVTCSTNVTSIADSGIGTLRDAIDCANSTPGTQTIDFAIPGGGVKTIQPLTPLPTVSDPAVIDGTTQPGSVGTPVIELDGSSMVGAGSGLKVTAGGTTIRGLAINNFPNGGITLRDVGGNTVVGSFVGVRPDGTTAAGNAGHGLKIVNSPTNTIGGLAVADRNVISDNSASGLLISGATSIGNVVQGNLIGTDVSGTIDIGNSQNGVQLSQAPSNTIGGKAAGAGNVISGNDRHGVKISGGAAKGNLLQGNMIGADITGTIDVGNSINGVLVSRANRNTIGGAAAGAGNVISGNDQNGVRFAGATAAGNVLQGNMIGTDVSGTNDVGNSLNGVVLNQAPRNRIGGKAAGAGNVISGNDQNGVEITGAAAQFNLLQGNLIGTDQSGTADLGNTQSGIFVSGAPSNVIGGTTATAGNVISGNDDHGLNLLNADSNSMQGNFIGTNAAASSTVGNAKQGVLLTNSNSNRIGGKAAGAGNQIAHNNRGVFVVGSSSGNSIVQNSFFSNSELGIDLAAVGVTPNDADDGDTGPNNLQNFPELTSVVLVGAQLNITYSVPSLPGNSTFPLQVEFYIADSSNREGRTLLGTDNYTAAGSVVATIAAGSAAMGDRIVATATDANGNTSEFSLSQAVAAAAPRLSSLPEEGGKDGELTLVDEAFAGFTPDD